MSVTQYIGARYVPLFADPIEWTNTRAYEPLTIVVHEGNSYTSKQAVPIGIEIDNTQFWALTGNYNAQIEQYRSEVSQFSEAIEANSEAIEAITTYLKGEKTPSYAEPQHVGDFIFNEQFGCVCKNGQLFYAFTHNEDDGHVHIVNMTTNSFQNKAIETGHANSCANDTVRQCVWLAPFGNKLFKYDYDFNSKTVVETNFDPYGVSFDSKTNTLWSYEVPSGTDTFGQTISFYKMLPNENEFTLAGTISDPFHHFMQNVFAQDLAVYDNIAIITDAVGFTYAVNLETFDVIGSFVIGNESSSWVYGENEGIEFDENGNLYQARISPFGFKENSTDKYEKQMCSVTNIVWEGTTEIAAQMLFSTAFNVTIDDTTQAAFSNARSQLKSANQLQWYKGSVGTLVYSGNVNEEQIIFAPKYPDVGIQIKSGAIVSIFRITIIKGVLNLYIESGGTLNFTAPANYPIASTSPRASAFYLNNAGTLNFEYENFGAMGTTAIPSAIRNTGTTNKQLKFNGVALSGTYTLLAGNQIIFSA